MTDREALLELLKRFGLSPATVGDQPDLGELKLSKQPNSITLQADVGDVGGYDGFVADWHFDADGKFVELKLWE